MIVCSALYNQCSPPIENYLMSAKNKTWKKPKIIEMDIGKCRYCDKNMVNTESFVAFADKTKGHYSCMEKDYYKSLINKNKEVNNRLGSV